MHYFPIFADLQGRNVLLIGAGDIAERKAESLLSAGARIQVIAPTLSPAFHRWIRAGRIQWLASTFEPAHLQNIYLVISATGHAGIDAQVFAEAEKRRVLCNTVDSPEYCSWIMPAIIDRSPIQIAISSGGSAPVLARHWRQKIEALLPVHTGQLAAIAGRWRARVQARLTSARERRRFWEDLFGSRFQSLVAQGDIPAAETELQHQLDGKISCQGEIVLIHTHPDNPGLLTILAMQALQAADLVLHDASISSSVRQQIRKDAEKVLYHPQRAQRLNSTSPLSNPHDSAIHYLLEQAQQGQRVVWLRSSHDPQITASVRTALRHLESTDIPCRILACTALLDIPIRAADSHLSARTGYPGRPVPGTVAVARWQRPTPPYRRRCRQYAGYHG